MSFSKNRLDQLDASITVRLIATEKLKLQEDAELAGVSVSELVRRQYFNRPIVAQTDKNFFNGLAGIKSRLRQIGGQLKNLHNESKGVYRVQTAEGLRIINVTLDSIRTYMEALVEELKN